MRLEKAGQRREGLINYLKELGVYLGFSILSVVLHVGAKQNFILENHLGLEFAGVEGRGGSEYERRRLDAVRRWL